MQLLSKFPQSQAQAVFLSMKALKRCHAPTQGGLGMAGALPAKFVELSQLVSSLAAIASLSQLLVAEASLPQLNLAAGCLPLGRGGRANLPLGQ